MDTAYSMAILILTTKILNYIHIPDVIRNSEFLILIAIPLISVPTPTKH